MKMKMISWLVGMVLSRVSEEMVEGWVAKGLNLLEEEVLDSKNKIDDLVVLPMIALAREVFDIGEEED